MSERLFKNLKTALDTGNSRSIKGESRIYALGYSAFEEIKREYRKCRAALRASQASAKPEGLTEQQGETLRQIVRLAQTNSVSKTTEFRDYVHKEIFGAFPSLFPPPPDSKEAG